MTVHNVIRQEKVAVYDIKNDQDNLLQSFEVFFTLTLQKSRVLQIQGIKSAAVVIYRKPLTIIDAVGVRP